MCVNLYFVNLYSLTVSCMCDNPLQNSFQSAQLPAITTANKQAITSTDITAFYATVVSSIDATEQTTFAATQLSTIKAFFDMIHLPSFPLSHCYGHNNITSRCSAFLLSFLSHCFCSLPPNSTFLLSLA